MKLVKAGLAGALVVFAGIPMGATAAAPAARLAPSSLTFGAENPAGPYPPQSVTVSNSGDASLIISNVTIENPGQSTGSDFTQTNSCYPFPRSLAAGESCAINVGFFPGEYGVRRGTLLIFDNGNPGEGMGQSPDIAFIGFVSAPPPVCAMSGASLIGDTSGNLVVRDEP